MRIIPFSPPDLTEAEIEEVVDTLRSGWITTGKKTKQLEQEVSTRSGTLKSACLASATAAMECVLRLLGIGEGDEVITSAYTYSASASVIAHVGAKIVLCDTEKDSFFMDYKQLESLITPRTKAIIPVDLGGKPCDYDIIFEILERKKELFNPNNKIQQDFGRVIVMADAAHSFGASYKDNPIGSVADFTCYSFHAVKNLTTAEGGAVTWKTRDFLDDEEIYKQFMLLSLHGQNKDAFAKSGVGNWEYDIIAPLYKCNMTDVLASIGLAQLKRYDEMLEKRRLMIQIYNDMFAGERFSFLEHYNDDYYSSGHLYLLKIKDISLSERNDLIVKMGEKGITCNVHYKPLPMLTAYKNLGFNIENYPNAFAQFENEITLPLNTLMSYEDVHYVASTLLDLLD